MPRYEYKVVPAPAKGRKAKGLKSPESRFALVIETTLNEMGAEGWEYLRAELLPSDERSGLTGSTVNWRNVLVFRRPVDGEASTFAPRLLEAHDPAAPLPHEPAAPAPRSAPANEPPLRTPLGDDGDDDNGVEETRETESIGAALKARARLASGPVTEG